MERKAKIVFLLNTPLDYNIRAVKTILSLLSEYELFVFCNGKSTVPNLLKDHKFDLVDISEYLNTTFLNRHFLIGDEFKGALNFIISQLKLSRPDIIYTADLTTLNCGVELKKEFDAKLIYDSYEIYVETINQYYPIERGGLRALIYKLVIYTSKIVNFYREKNYIKEVDLFVTTCESFLNYFLSKYRIGESAIIRNTPPYTNYESIVSIDLHAKFGISKHKKIVLYIGTFNSGRSLDKLVLSAKHLSENYYILFLGFGPLREFLEELVVMNALESKVGIHGPYEMEDTLRYCKGADLGVLLIDNTNLSKYYASANKVFDFMMVRVPILLSKAPENEKLIKEVECGKIILNLTPEEIARDIELILTDINIDKMGKNGLAYSADYGNWRIDEEVLLKKVKSLVESRVGSINS